MNDLRKVLVVDDGDRGFVDPLACELSELGLASVTTSLEAAQDVIKLIEEPSAIVLKMPENRDSPSYDCFLELADELRARTETAHVPVVLWERTSAFQAGGISAVLRHQYGSQVLASQSL